MAPTNIKTVHQTPLFHIESNLDRLGLLSPTHGQRSQQQSGQITLQSASINKPKFRKATRHAEARENCNTEVHGDGGLKLVKPAREPAFSRAKPGASLKNAPDILSVPRSLLAHVGRRKIVVRGQFFPQKPLSSRL